MNKQILLASRPAGFPTESNFRLAESPIPQPVEGQVLVRGLYLSVDPYMRGRMRETASYAPPVTIGEVIIGGVVGEVIESRNPVFKNGDIVEGMLGWQQYAVASPEGLRKIDPSIAPISTALGILGMPGMTAYFGMLEICHPKAGETVVVSGAAGAVGSLVGQIAKIHGCRAVGVAGSDEKVRHIVKDLGFDAGFNYKTTSDYRAKLAELCPGGIDIYFDNVGGAITDAAVTQINLKARIAVCGQISQYNLEKPEPGLRPYWNLLGKRARVEGFLIFDYVDRYQEALTQMAQWLREGKLKYREQIAEGIENAPAAFIGMLKGANIGKQLVKI